MHIFVLYLCLTVYVMHINFFVVFLLLCFNRYIRIYFIYNYVALGKRTILIIIYVAILNYKHQR